MWVIILEDHIAIHSLEIMVLAFMDSINHFIAIETLAQTDISTIDIMVSIEVLERIGPIIAIDIILTTDQTEIMDRIGITDLIIGMTGLIVGVIDLIAGMTGLTVGMIGLTVGMIGVTDLIAGMTGVADPIVGITGLTVGIIRIETVLPMAQQVLELEL